MKFQIIRCPYCGCEGHLETRDDKWYCVHCDNVCTDDAAEKAYEKLKANIGAQMAGVIDDALLHAKEEEYYNLRSLLWDKVHAKYTDSAAIVSICREIKKLDPHDFLACFFEIANTGTPEELSQFINNISVSDNGMFIETVLDFMIKSLTTELIMPVGYLIERAYKNTDLQKFEDLSTKLEAEAEKVESGIYSTLVPRDVFIAYSSKDIDKVIELMNLLEANGLSCFVALRNLQHGRGAVANYSKALREAIDNAKMVVFISSKNSRSFSCDALKEELRYIRESELRNAPLEFRNDYAKLPPKYKKPRIEYRLDNTKTPAVDRFISEFFAGLDYCESSEKVLERISEYIFYGGDFFGEEDTATKASVKKAAEPDSSEEFKYCTSCGSKNMKESRFCAECGGNTFADSNEKFCTSCKAKNSIKTKFCVSCGGSDFVYTESDLKKVESERKKHEEVLRLAHAEAERRARAEQERKARAEAERKAREEAERNAQIERERAAREEAARRAAQAEQERKARQETESSSSTQSRSGFGTGSIGGSWFNSTTHKSASESTDTNGSNRFKFTPPPKGYCSKWITLAICVFYLGFFGIHRFYEGDKKWGLIYMFTFGLFGCGWIYDIFRILGKPDVYPKVDPKTKKSKKENQRSSTNWKSW